VHWLSPKECRVPSHLTMFLVYSIFQDYLKLNFSWKDLFELYPYANTYTWFTKIHLSAANQEDLSDWVGWVKSRFRCLLIKVRTSHFGSTLSI